VEVRPAISLVPPGNTSSVAYLGYVIHIMLVTDITCGAILASRAVKEPVGIMMKCNKCPDGSTLLLWAIEQLLM